MSATPRLFDAEYDQASSGMSDEITLRADGGGKVPAIRDALEGKAAVLAFLTRKLHRYWADFQWCAADINGARGAVLTEAAEALAAAHRKGDST